MNDQVKEPRGKKPENRKARRGRSVGEKHVAVPGEVNAAVPDERTASLAGERTAAVERPAAVAGKPAAKTPWYEHKVAMIAITTVFTVLGGISLALFNSWWKAPQAPSAKPPEVSAAPQELSATLAKPTIETNVTLAKGLEASNSPTTGLTEEQLALNGYLVHVQMKLVGFKGRHTFVRWELHDADTKARISIREYFPSWSDEQTPLDVLAEAATDTAAPKFWVPAPPGNRPFFVRVMIYDDKGTELTFADSDAVRPTPATKPRR